MGHKTDKIGLGFVGVLNLTEKLGVGNGNGGMIAQAGEKFLGVFG